MVASGSTSSNVHSNFSKGDRYSMNHKEFALLVRKIYVPEPDHIMITTDKCHDSCLEAITSGDGIILSPRRPGNLVALSEL